MLLLAASPQCQIISYSRFQSWLFNLRTILYLYVLQKNVLKKFCLCRIQCNQKLKAQSIIFNLIFTTVTHKGFVNQTCGDLGINSKTPNQILTHRLPHTKCINASPCIRLHASIRLKIRKKKNNKK